MACMIAAGAATPFWIDKDGKRHNNNIVKWSEAKAYGLDSKKSGLAPMRVWITVESRCWFLNRGGYGGWLRDEWKVIGANKVEIDGGEDYGDGIVFGVEHNNSKRRVWNVFGVDTPCSEVPNVEDWVVWKLIGGKWKAVSTARFYLEP